VVDLSLPFREFPTTLFSTGADSDTNGCGLLSTALGAKSVAFSTDEESRNSAESPYAGSLRVLDGRAGRDSPQMWKALWIKPKSPHKDRRAYGIRRKTRRWLRLFTGV
jgi:hypothetical protein